MASISNGTSCDSSAVNWEYGQFLSVKSLMDGGVYEIPIYTWESNEEDKRVDMANLKRHSKGISCEQVAKMYDEWDTYEQDLSPGRYNGPRYAADAVARNVSDKSHDIRILDVAAGTGKMGQQLAARGFTKLDALDGSSVMLEQAAKTGTYDKCIQELFGAQDSHIPNDTYDVIAIAGGMGEGHIPCSALSEMVRVVTPGGLVVIVMRCEYLTNVDDYRGRLEPAMEKLVQKRYWQRVETIKVPCYSFGKDGMVYVFRVTQNGAPDCDII